MAWEFIHKEGRALAAAPLTFIVAGGLIATGAWFLTSWAYDRQIQTLNAIIGQKDGIIDQRAEAADEMQRLIESLNATIEDLRETNRRVERLERRLDDDEKVRLRSELEATPSSIVIETPESPDGITKDLIDILRESGWQVTSDFRPVQTGNFAIRTDDPAAVENLNRALEDAGLDVLTGAGPGGSTEFLLGGSKLIQ